jgi:DNA transposition AAA+ family ATPase
MGVRESFEAWRERTGRTLSYVSRATGVSSAALSQWRTGKYVGDSKKIDDQVASFLRRERDKSDGDLKRAPFVMTSVAKRIFVVLRDCHIQSLVGVIVANAGDGKTYAIQEYCRRNRDAILVEADQGYTSLALFTMLHRVLGSHTGKESMHETVEGVIDRLRDSGRMIIVDEAENLPVKALDLLRRVYDKAGVGIVLAGMPRLEANLRGKCGELAQLHSRVGFFAKLAGITERDAEDIVAIMLPGSNGIWDHMYRKVRGNARSMVLLALRARAIAKTNNTAVDEVVVDNAATVLMI